MPFFLIFWTMKLKTNILLTLVILLVFQAYPGQTTTSYSQIKSNVKPYSFVVIGAFVFQKNAREFTKYARLKNMNAKFAINPYRNLYYVYTFYSEEKEKAVEEVYKVREKFNIPDAWVYSGPLAGMEGTSLPELNYGKIDKSDYEPPTYTYLPENKDEEEVVLDQEPVVKDNLPEATEEIVTEVTIEPRKETQIEVVQEETTAVEDRPFGVVKPVAAEEPVIKEDFKLYINSINSKQMTEVSGEVEIFDEVRNRKLKEASTQTLFGLNDPRNSEGTVRVISRIFGYRPKEQVVNLYSPVKSDTLGMVYTIGDSIVLDMPLDRLQKGDIAVMWNVLFYKDAAIMRPESKAELNSLLEMLQENLDMKIKLHGHTNGNSRGNIVYADENDFNFFSLNGDHSKTTGTAKKLSEYRANAILRWLESNGIEASRMEPIGWGGDRMLHGKTDPKAYENVRVEVEVVEN